MDEDNIDNLTFDFEDPYERKPKSVQRIQPDIKPTEAPAQIKQPITSTESQISPVLTLPLPTAEIITGAPAPKPLNPRAYWATHVYKRRSVKEVQDRGFIGWPAIIDLVERMKMRGDQRLTNRVPWKTWGPEGFRDATWVSTLFLGGFRRQEMTPIAYMSFGQRFVFGLRKIHITEKGQYIYFQQVPVLKKYKRLNDTAIRDKDGQVHYTTKRIEQYRNFAFPIREPDTANAIHISSYLLEYLDKVPTKNDFLFPMSPVRMYKIMVDTDPSYFMHRLRAERASQLREDYNFSFEDLLAWFRWNNILEAQKYTGTSISSWEKKFERFKDNAFEGQEHVFNFGDARRDNKTAQRPKENETDDDVFRA